MHAEVLSVWCDGECPRPFRGSHAQRGQTGTPRDERSFAAAHRSKKVPLLKGPQAIWSGSAGTPAGLSPGPPDKWRCTDWRPPPSGWLWCSHCQPDPPVLPPAVRGRHADDVDDWQALSMSNAAATLRPAVMVRVFDIEIPPCRRLDLIGSSPAANDFLHSRTDRTASVACGRASSNVLRMVSVRDLLATRAAVWQVCYCKLTRVGVRTSRGAAGCRTPTPLCGWRSRYRATAQASMLVCPRPRVDSPSGTRRAALTRTKRSTMPGAIGCRARPAKPVHVRAAGRRISEASFCRRASGESVDCSMLRMARQATAFLSRRWTRCAESWGVSSQALNSSHRID